MKLNHVQDKIIRMLNANIVDADTIASELGRGYNKFKVQSMVLTLANKGAVSNLVASFVLHGTNMEKLIDYKHDSHLVKSLAK